VTHAGADFAGSAYLSLIEQQLDSEQRAKESFEQRGLALVTISGFLSGVVFALAAWKGAASLSTAAKITLSGAVVAFMVGAIFGVLTIRTKVYAEVSPSELERLLDSRYWEGPAEIGT